MIAFVGAVHEGPLFTDKQQHVQLSQAPKTKAQLRPRWLKVRMETPCRRQPNKMMEIKPWILTKLVAFDSMQALLRFQAYAKRTQNLASALKNQTFDLPHQTQHLHAFHQRSQQCDMFLLFTCALEPQASSIIAKVENPTVA